MAYVSMKQMLETGVHFGHQTRRWNPKMRPYIFGARNGIHIIDLQQTVKLFRVAYDKVVDTVANGGKVLFIGTKRQAQEAVATEATKANQYYVTNRWMGGTLTNFVTIQKSVERLKKLEGMFADGSINRYQKKEILLLEREMQKLDPGRYQEHGSPAPAGFHHRPPSRRHRREGMPQAGHPDRGRDRHQLRSRCHRLHHPRQR